MRKCSRNGQLNIRIADASDSAPCCFNIVFKDIQLTQLKLLLGKLNYIATLCLKKCLINYKAFGNCKVYEWKISGRTFGLCLCSV